MFHAPDAQSPISQSYVIFHNKMWSQHMMGYQIEATHIS